MQVEWTDESLDTLADFYVAADVESRLVIELAAERINRELAQNPLEHGESRDSLYRRVWFVPPLVVIFDVVMSEGKVVVNHLARRRGS